jgi:hypothetical protein
MAVRLRLADGRELLVQATLDELEAALRRATNDAALLRIEQRDGTVIAVSPSAVETMQEAPEAAAGLAERLAAA